MNPIAIIAGCMAAIIGATGLWATNELDLAGRNQVVSEAVYTQTAPALPGSAQEAPKPPAAYQGPGCTEYAPHALAAGFTATELPVILTILELESMCLPHVIGDNGHSYGLAQLHLPSWCHPNRWNPQGYLRARGVIQACDELLNPTINLQAAWWVYVEGGWSQWSTYNRALEVLQ
jgi:hypothetical protein